MNIKNLNEKLEKFIETCFNLRAIRKALDIESNYEFGNVVLYYLNDAKDDIVDYKVIKRDDVLDYKPNGEYYLERVRDSEIWYQDYNLAPVEKLIANWTSPFGEAFEIETEGKYPYAKFDVAGLYNTIFPETRGAISYDEMKQVQDFIGIDDTTEEYDLRACRNTIVKYWRELDDEFDVQYNELKEAGNEEEVKALQEKIMQTMDQMSAFTGTIDNILWNKGCEV